MGYAVFGRWDIFLGFDWLLGVGAVSFISLIRVTFLFRVAAAYVIYGEVFG